MTTTRYSFRGRLHLQTPLHIGSGRANELSDSPIRTDVAGKPLVPGTTLGGLLRTQAERIAPALQGQVACKGPGVKENEICNCLTCQLFGAVNPTTETDRFSRLVVRDAALLSTTAPTTIRDGIGISRLRQTVAQSLKFDWQVLAAGLEFGFELYLDTDQPVHLQLLCAALSEMMAGRVRLGGRSGRGTGRFVLILDELGEASFGKSDIAQLKTYLKAPPAQRYTRRFLKEELPTFIGQNLENLHSQLQSPPPTTPNFVEAEVQFEFDYGLLINSPANAVLEGTNSAFVRTLRSPDGQETLYLPGSSLRGMLRSQAERIARTLSANAAKNPGVAVITGFNDFDYPLYSRIIAACDPLAVPQGDDEPKEPGDVTGSYAGLACSHKIRGKLAEWQKQDNSSKKLADQIREASCLACRLFGNSYLAGRLKVSDAFPLSESELDPKGATLQRMDFVAIDRFTGGARDTAKFEAKAHFSRQLPDQKLAFKCFLTLHDLDLAKDGWIIGWLTYVLRDLALGDLRLGLGKAKGLGLVHGKVQSIIIGGLQSANSAVDLLKLERPVNSPDLFYQATLDNTMLDSRDPENPARKLLVQYAGQFDSELNRFQTARQQSKTTQE